MKKLLLMAMVLCFTSKNYSLNEEWLKYFEQANFDKCLRKRSLVQLNEEDKRIALEKVNEAIKKIEESYVSLVGKTVLQDYLIFLLIASVNGAGLGGLISSYGAVRFLRSYGNNRRQTNTNDITGFHQTNNQAQIQAILNYDNWLKSTWFPQIEKDYKFKFIGSLCGITLGLSLGVYWLIRYNKHKSSWKNMMAWVDLKLLKQSLLWNF